MILILAIPDSLVCLVHVATETVVGASTWGPPAGQDEAGLLLLLAALGYVVLN